MSIKDDLNPVEVTLLCDEAEAQWKRASRHSQRGMFYMARHAVYINAAPVQYAGTD